MAIEENWINLNWIKISFFFASKFLNQMKVI